MVRFIRAGMLVMAVGACGSLAGPLAAAQASDATLLSTFKAANTKLDRDEVKVGDGFVTYELQNRSGPVIRALRHEVGDIHALTRKLKHESASTANGRKGKADIDAGLGLIAKVYGSLATDIQKAGTTPLAKSTVEAALKTDKKGRSKLLTGLKLLGG